MTGKRQIRDATTGLLLFTSPAPVSGSQNQNPLGWGSKAHRGQTSRHSLMRIQPNYFETLTSVSFCFSGSWAFM